MPPMSQLYYLIYIIIKEMDQHPEFDHHPSHLQRAWPLWELNPVFGLLGGLAWHSATDPLFFSLLTQSSWIADGLWPEPLRLRPGLLPASPDAPCAICLGASLQLRFGRTQRPPESFTFFCIFPAYIPRGFRTTQELLGRILAFNF